MNEYYITKEEYDILSHYDDLGYEYIVKDKINGVNVTKGFTYCSRDEFSNVWVTLGEM